VNGEQLLRTDSIQELAEFWDTHDLTEFEEELEVVERPVFERKIGEQREPEISAE